MDCFIINSLFVSFFFVISKVFVFLKTQFNNLRDSELLKFLVWKPDATDLIPEPQTWLTMYAGFSLGIPE